MIGIEVRTLVVGHRVVEVELETDDRPRSLGLVVRVDGAKRWSSEEPGWRDIACGVDGDVFVWSARRLVVIPLEERGSGVQAVDCEEDIVTVFQVEDGWLIVCEASVRLVGVDVGLSKLELPEVVTGARWDCDRLLIGCDDGKRVLVAVAAGQLYALPAS